MRDEEKRKRTCCFTGHRILPDPYLESIKKRTEAEICELVLEKNVRYFAVGGAIGYDTLAAESLFWLRESQFPHIKVILVYPFDGFTREWTTEQRIRYNALLRKYDKVVCADIRANREAYLFRNRCLVDGSAYCISYCTRSFGGTAYTIRYARKSGVQIRNVAHSLDTRT
jgi:uncharacterized phage-like protein YoqJ